MCDVLYIVNNFIVYSTLNPITAMKPQFKILVATDYSEPAMNAEKYAVMFAKATNSVLVFFHAFEASFSYPHEFVNLERIDDSPVEFELRRLEQHIEELFHSMNLTFHDVEYHCMTKQGTLTKELYKEASIYNADLIILGTHEFDTASLSAVFAGSHTWNIIKNAPIPVLAIPPQAKFKDMQHIVFATEYREGEIPAIKFLASIANQLNARLTLLHINNHVFSTEFEKEMFNRFKEDVTSVITYDKLGLQLIHNDNLVDGLNGFCTQVNANWLVMSHEKATVLAKWVNPLSATKRMTSHTHIPLFAIPDKYDPERKPSNKSNKKGGDLWNAFFVSDGYSKN
jgi:nucleotide-binding universal stress UspA family protein